MGSSIYTPSIPGVMERFGVGPQLASMGLSMYVLAYGLGPMLFSPLSELPLIGRNPPYMITFAIYVILLVPTALVDNFPGLIVLRFLAGFFGSPCLATGGASLQDMFSLIKLPYVLSLWALAATCGPALGRSTHSRLHCECADLPQVQSFRDLALPRWIGDGLFGSCSGLRVQYGSFYFCVSPRPRLPISCSAARIVFAREHLTRN